MLRSQPAWPLDDMGGRCRRVLLGLLFGVLQTSAFVPLHVTKAAEGGRSLLPVSRRHKATRLHYKAGDSYELYKELPKEAVDEIEEGAARDMLERLESWEVAVPEEVAEGGKVRVTGVGPRARRARFDLPAVVLLHGFDSSCLEYRRLHPLLDEEVDVFALDVLGWGFSQLEGVKSFSAEAKRAYLYGFWNDVLQRRPMVLVGASLGGAIAIDFSHAHPQAVDKLVFLNPQAFIDGLGGMSSLPRPLASLGISVLKSVPLRRYAGQLSYYDPKTWSNEDAMRIGRLHCLRDGWSEAAVDYMLSGGYNTIDKVSSLQAKSVLVLWGRQDKILEPSVVERLGQELPQARITFVENCGHVAHLEKPRAAANAMLDFVIRPAATPPTLPWAQGRDVSKVSCRDCLDEEVVPCPNCEGQGWYESFGRRVDCKACRTTGLVICRSCYKGDPEDVPGIRETVRQAAARLGRPPPKVMP